jgi:FAD:protein FMN transferase
MSAGVQQLSRRRALLMLGMGGGASFLCAGDRARRPLRLYRWEGTSLGSPARLLLYHTDREAAAQAIGRCVAEIERLERSFALYREDSEIARLNREGRLAAPSQELLVLLSRSVQLSELSDGAFDITVQTLWTLYARHFFAAATPPAEGPSQRAIEDALKLVSWRDVEIGTRLVRLARPGMGVTLNGIAQGYVTDRVTEILRGQGCKRVLADLGRSEIEAMGAHPDGLAWRIGIVDPRRPEAFARVLDLGDGALCTSGGYGTIFEPSGRHHHLFDPKRGGSANRLLAVSVLAPSATVADGLSTALYVASPERARALVASFPGVRALITHPDGEMEELSAADGDFDSIVKPKSKV